MKIDPPADDTDSHVEGPKVHFLVEEVLKGKVGREVIDTQGSGADCKIGYEVGERYLIYDYGYDPKTKMIDTSYCAGSASLESAEKDIKYIRNRSTEKLSLLGRVLLDRYEPIVGASVEVLGPAKKLEAITNEQGDFDIPLAKAGEYEVTVTVPFSGGALEYVGEKPLLTAQEPTEKQTVFRYKATLAKGECSYKQITVFKVDLKATAAISGKITETSEKPVAKLTMYLFPAAKDQDTSSGNYKFSTTKEDGSYSFEGLRAGDYYLGINIGRMPEVDAPYPTTFYPGVDSSERARVIHLAQGPKLDGIDLRAPQKLIERVISGVIVWPDGQPVTKFSPDSDADFGPLLSMRDPNRLWYPLNSRRSDGSITETKDRQGNFSFIGFEGYSYVIHVHAFDANDTVMHAKHIKITVGEKNPPLRLVLAIPGYGGKEDEITKELNDP